MTNEVLAWSEARPAWQRDALRRIATAGLLTGNDIQELAALALDEVAGEVTEPRATGPWPATAGLTPVPLAAVHLPVTDAATAGVRLAGLADIRGVNAIVPDAELPLGIDGLTVISGWNGAGKTGYARILKRVCRSRAPEEPVLPDVHAGSGAPQPGATVRYRVGADEREVHWHEGEACRDEQLARVSFFDARAAVVHVEKRVDVAYTPAGLDLLASLAEACQQVETVLQHRLRALQDRARSWPLLGTGTGEVGTALDGLGTGKGLAEVVRLAALSETDRAALRTLPGRIAELSATDPARRAAEAGVRAGQLDELARALREAGTGLHPDRMARLAEAAMRIMTLEESAAAASAERFADEPLPGVGSAAWRAMWAAAAAYSAADAYPGHEFPHLHGAACVLCQQPLDADAASRLRRYAQFVADDLEGQRQVQAAELDASRAGLRALALTLAGPNLAASLEVAGLHDTGLRQDVAAALVAATTLAGLAMDPVGNRDALKPAAADLAATGPDRLAETVGGLADAEREEAGRLAGLDSSAAAVSGLWTRLDQLKARAGLAAVLGDVLAEHDRRLDERVVIAAIRSCATTAITRMSSELAATGVDALCRAFAAELDRLGLTEVEVTLAADGARRGLSYVRVALPDTTRELVPRVLSEGERGVVALAAFLAELTVRGDSSAVVLDDPVTSLDHRFRRTVAERLVAEAARRQVIVFTHDTVFVNDLANAANEHDLGMRAAGIPAPLSVTYRHLVRTDAGTGVVSHLGGRSPKVANRLEAIERDIAEARRLYLAGDEAGYERAARALLRPLRDAWERAIEEVLLREIVVRHGSEVRTRSLRYLSHITDADVATVELGMTVESRFVHDAPVGDESPAPPPDWLRAEVATLRGWVKELRERYKAIDRKADRGI